MDKRKMCDFVTFIPGINTTRAEKQFGTLEIDYYDQAAFEMDYNHEEGFMEDNPIRFSEGGISLSVGDVVISNSIQLSAIVGKSNEGKVPSLNFTKVEFRNNGIDKRYFVYLFNTYSGVKRQKERELQGTGMIMRIPIKSLNEIIIPIISIKEQRKIGMAYSEMLKLQNNLTKYTELIEKFVNSILEESLKES